LKTQIITLESHDDLVSVRDKLSWVKTPRVLLVWPKYEQVTLRVLDLKVLQRHADSLGSQLGLVTRRANVRRDAESLGIPVFDSTAAAQKDLWPASGPKTTRIPKTPRRDLRKIRDQVYEKEAAWRTSLPGRISAFTLGVIAVLALAGLFVPRATVTLYPESRTQTATIPVSAGESVESISITGSIPARALSIVVSSEGSLAITNEISVPRSKAQGIARFTNLSQREVNIPAGTVISTVGELPIHYVTLHETLLPPGTDEFVDVPIEALQPGSSGNMPVDSIVAVDGPVGLLVSVTNPNLVSGGTNSTLTGATEDDRDELREVVMDNLRRDAESKLRAQISPSDIFLSDTFEVLQVIEEAYDPPVGEAGKTLVLKMQVEFSARYVSAEDLKQLSLSTLDLAVPDEFQPFGAALFKPLTEPSTDTSGITHFEIDVSRTLLREIDETRVFPVVRGRGPSSIEDDLLADLSLRQQPDIALTPSWWPWMPLIPFNISVEVK
jgi:hypothetical protein